MMVRERKPGPGAGSIALLMAMLMLAGCARDYPQLRPPPPAVSVPRDQPVPALYLERFTHAIPPGAVLGRHERCWFSLLACTGPFSQIDSSDIPQGNFEREGYSRLLFQALAPQGFVIADHPQKIFERHQARRTAPFQIGAILTGVEFRLRRREAFWLADGPDRVSGTVAMAIDWKLYDADARQVVYRVQTHGMARLDAGLSSPVTTLLQAGFLDAARRLGADPGFRAALGMVPERPRIPDDPVDQPRDVLPEELVITARPIPGPVTDPPQAALPMVGAAVQVGRLAGIVARIGCEAGRLSVALDLAAPVPAGSPVRDAAGADLGRIAGPGADGLYRLLPATQSCGEFGLIVSN